MSIIESLCEKRVQRAYTVDYHFGYGYLYHNGGIGETYYSLLNTFIDTLPTSHNQPPIVCDIATGLSSVPGYIRSKGITCVGTDINLGALDNSKNILLEPTPLVQSTAWRLPFASESLAGVHMKDALVHMPSSKTLLREIHRVLKPRGTTMLVSEEPNLLMLFLSNVAVFSREPWYFPVNENRIIRKASQQGFSLLYTNDWSPSALSRDWYQGITTRFVLLLQKNE